MKNLDPPLPYRYKHTIGKVVYPGSKVVKTSKLISLAFNDMLYSIFKNHKIKKSK